jgi:hypothetical protein
MSDLLLYLLDLNVQNKSFSTLLKTLGILHIQQNALTE